MEIAPMLRRRLLRRIAYLRRNRCSLLPAALLARALIVIEQVLGVMYVAFLIARPANPYGAGGRPKA